MRGGATLTLVALLLGATAAQGQQAPRARIDRSVLAGGREAVAGSWLFVFEPGSGGERGRLALHGRGVTQTWEGRLEPRIVAVRGLPERAVERLLDLPGLRAVFPDALLRLQLEESSPLIRADESSLATAGFPDVDGEGVRACVVDSGIRASHEAFGGRVDVSAGINTADGGNDTSDVEGHGTHVASTLAGNWPSGRRGVAPAATLVPVRACLANSECPTSAVIAGIDHCADPEGGNADLINLSLGGTSFLGACDSDPLAMAANAAVAAGLVVVAASGNDGIDNAIDTPACGSSVLSIGAVYDDNFLTSCGAPFSEIDERACFSNAGPELDLMAPGSQITAAGRDSDTAIRVSQGTSMATPHVAGLAALLLSQDPSLTPAEVGELLRANAVDLGEPGRDDEYGHGRIDAVATLLALTSCGGCSDPGWGDLHPEGGDENLSLADWLALRRVVLGSEMPSAEQLLRGDLSPASSPCRPAEPPVSWCPTGDGGLDLDDLAALRQVLSGVSVFSCAPCASETPPVDGAGHRRPGDVAPAGGGDGSLDVADVLRLLRFAVLLETPTAEELLRGDLAPAISEDDLQVIDGDEIVDVSDVLLALQAAVDLAQLAWPGRELLIHAEFDGGVAAARFELSGWPAWAVPGGEGTGCGAGGGLDAAADSWSVTCAWDPVELPSGSLLARPWYRAPEAVSPASLAIDAEAVDGALETVPLSSVSLSP